MRGVAYMTADPPLAAVTCAAQAHEKATASETAESPPYADIYRAVPACHLPKAARIHHLKAKLVQLPLQLATDEGSGRQDWRLLCLERGQQPPLECP
jgi:hypothetical protein